MQKQICILRVPGLGYNEEAHVINNDSKCFASTNPASPLT